jgi:hypothetical protein
MKRNEIKFILKFFDYLFYLLFILKILLKIPQNFFFNFIQLISLLNYSIFFLDCK